VGFELLHNKSCPAKRTSGPADGITKAGVMAFTIIHPRSNGSGSAQNVSPRSKQTARSTDSSRKARSKNGGTKLLTNFRSPSKGHRYITHDKKLIDVEEPVIRCRDAASPLGNRLAAVVWQLPAFLKKTVERLEKFLQILHHWKLTRHAIEFRHETWFDEEVAECLMKHAVAVCMSDAPDWPMWDRITTDMVYIRLHGHTRKYASNYSKRSLKKWATRAECWLQDDRDVHVYFDNDAEGAAPNNALTLLDMVRQRHH